MGDTPDYVNGQPKPIPNNGKSIHDLVRRDLARMHSNGAQLHNRSVQLVATHIADRKQYGLEKYGTILQAHNGRDALTDIMEEALDLVVYIRQWLEEQSHNTETSARDRVDEHLMGLVYKQALQSLVMIKTVMNGRD